MRTGVLHISLCLSVFWWTKLHHGKSGVKVHTLFDVKNSIPSFVIITGAETHDSQVMDQIPYEVDSFYIFDRAYMDTKQLYSIDNVGAFFVVREKQKNAVKIQVFAAIITYCLVSLIETEMAEEMTTYEILRVLSTSLLVKMPLRDLLTHIAGFSYVTD